MYLNFFKIVAFGVFVTFPVGNLLSQLRNSKTGSTKILVEPEMSGPLRFAYGDALLLQSYDDSVLLVGGMLDPLLPEKRVHLVIWKLESLKVFNAIIKKEGPATFGTPIGKLQGTQFMTTHAEQTLGSVEVVANIFDACIRLDMVDRLYSLLRVEREKIRGYVVIPKKGLQQYLSVEDFLQFP